MGKKKKKVTKTEKNIKEKELRKEMEDFRGTKLPAYYYISKS